MIRRRGWGGWAALAPAAVLALGWMGSGCGSSDETPAAGPRLPVFAAASLAPVFESLASSLDVALDVQVGYNHASSSALARQIHAGAPAAVFVSANPEWMDWLEERGHVVSGSRRVVAENSLVLVAKRGESFPFSIAEGNDAERAALADAFAGRFAVADPEHVPAGMYARQALRSAGWWAALEPRVVAALDARNALALVERGECAAGIVYRSDAANSDRIDVVAEIPEAWHAPIRYVGAAVAGADTVRAVAWLDALSSSPVVRRLEQFGFRVPQP